MSRFASSSPLPDDRMTIVCLHCNRAQEVGRKAMSMTCKYCSKSLQLEDVPIDTYKARRVLETCGIVTIEKKGNLVVDRVHSGSGVIVRGRVKGDIKSHGPVLVGPEADIRGNVTAPTIAIGAGATLEGQFAIGPASVPPPDTSGLKPPGSPENPLR